MAHNEHNKSKRSGAFFLIILGAFLFIVSPIWFADKPEIGFSMIALGFAIGGLGFYLRFIRK
jgi:vacuolar-type H+-ATPase subunit I/STV1